jgi:hypothetical protein
MTLYINFGEKSKAEKFFKTCFLTVLQLSSYAKL